MCSRFKAYEIEAEPPSVRCGFLYQMYMKVFCGCVGLNNTESKECGHLCLYFLLFLMALKPRRTLVLIRFQLTGIFMGGTEAGSERTVSQKISTNLLHKVRNRPCNSSVPPNEIRLRSASGEPSEEAEAMYGSFFLFNVLTVINVV
jgi:hypothetical protein